MGTITFLCCCFEKPGDGIIDNERRLNSLKDSKTPNQNCIIVLLQLHSIKGFDKCVVIRTCDLRSLI